MCVHKFAHFLAPLHCLAHFPKITEFCNFISVPNFKLLILKGFILFPPPEYLRIIRIKHFPALLITPHNTIVRT